MAKQETRSVTTQVEINAPVEAVWKALTDAKELINWFPLDAKVTPGVGGSIWMSWRNEYEFATQIEIWEPNKHLRTTSKGESEAFPPAEIAVDYHLESMGNKTILRLVHSGFSKDADWDGLYDGTIRGWAYQLWGLDHYLKHHPGSVRQTIYERRFLKELSLQQAWQRLWSADGIKVDESKPLRKGAPYQFTTITGSALKGIVQTYTPNQDFIATVENLNNATLRFEFLDMFGRRDITVIFSIYGMPKSEVDLERKRWADLLDEIIN